MYEKSAFIFWITLILYIVTLLTVSYVGVYLTYIAMPLIVVSGLIMKLSKPTEKTQIAVNTTSSTIKETGKAVNNFLNETSSTLDNFNNFLQVHNEKNRLIRLRTEPLRENINKLKIAKIEPEIKLKYAQDELEKKQYTQIINHINNQIIEVEKNINQIKRECELEVARIQR